MTEQMMIDLMLANQAEKYEKQLAELRADLAAAQKQVKALLKLFPSVEAMCEFGEMKVNWSDNTIAVIKEATTWLEEDK